MTDPEYRQGECAETSGFLFSHTCGDMATAACTGCGKPICHQHTVEDIGEGPLCVSCAKQQRRRPPSETGRRYAYDPVDDDPYFYAGYYYTDYYWDTHDFTESDEAVLSGGEAGADDMRAFEDDMGAS